MPDAEADDTAPGPPWRLADSTGLRVPGLLVVMATALAVRAWPLTRFAVWGSDTGEYYFLTARLVRSGSISFAYEGWGLAYPYFPGLYAFAGSLRVVVGLPVGVAVAWSGPILGALVAGVVALLADHVAEDGWAGLVAGLVAATAMPLVFVTSHTMPGTYGHLLAAAVLLLAYVGGVDLWGVPGGADRVRFAARRLGAWAVVAAPLVLLLPVTHHLSLYVTVGALVGGAALRELARSRTHRSRAAWEAGLVVALVALATAWWLGVATPFRDRIVSGLVPGGAAVVVGLAFLGLLAPAGLVAAARRLRSRDPGGAWKRVQEAGAWLARVRFPSGAGSLVAVAATFPTLVAAGLLVTVTGIPGTRIQVTPRSLVQVLPMVAAVSLAAPGAVAAAGLRGGEAVRGWLLALLASFTGAVVTGSHVLLPYRHADYMVVAAAVLAGAGALALRGLPTWARRAGPAALGLLVVLNGAAAYPPPAVMGGFQEGVAEAEMEAVRWAGRNLPEDAMVATDHRLSSMLFGYGGVDATWDSSGPFLHAPNASAALEHRELPSPSGLRNVTHALVSPVMRDVGVALYQWENAEPLSEAAEEKFQGPAFPTLYERDGVAIHRVNATAASP
jgi:hypothetical protein